MHVLKDIILESDKLAESDGVIYYLAKLLKEIKESEEGSMHSVNELKQAILQDMYGTG